MRGLMPHPGRKSVVPNTSSRSIHNFLLTWTEKSCSRRLFTPPKDNPKLSCSLTVNNFYEIAQFSCHVSSRLLVFERDQGWIFFFFSPNGRLFKHLHLQNSLRITSSLGKCISWLRGLSLCAVQEQIQRCICCALATAIIEVIVMASPNMTVIVASLFDGTKTQVPQAAYLKT